MIKPLIELKNVDVALDGQTILYDITWRMNSGEHWAIMGGNGSGKSTLLKLIRADLCPAPGKGSRTYGFDGAWQTTAVGIKERVALVSPELQERYLQQEWNLTGLQVVHSGLFNTDYVYQKLLPDQKAFARNIVRLLGIEQLLMCNVQQLSTGELRKILIARALAGKPRVLILDKVCDGLDARARAHLLEMIEAIARAGSQILYATHRNDEMISAITHVLVLKEGRIVRQGEKTHVDGGNLQARPAEVGRIPATPPSQLPACSFSSSLKPALIRLRSASVFLNRKKVLHDINWEMLEGQNWVIFGPNGAGKSTLLRLICGDLHAAAGSEVWRFNLTATDSVWDLKQRLGYLSPALQANYRADLTGAQVIASGLFSSLGLLAPVTRRQRKIVASLVDRLDLGGLANKNTLRMSYGEFRKVLLARALVNNPQILICDEPFDGLDGQSKMEFATALEQVSANGTRLIAVTHHLDDLPRCITHGLLLDKGRVVCQGKLEIIRRHPLTRRLFWLG